MLAGQVPETIMIEGTGDISKTSASLSDSSGLCIMSPLNVIQMANPKLGGGLN